MEERYVRNIPSVSEKDMELLRCKRVLVLGCGGLGGYVIEYLARLGIGGMTVVDGDVFSASNLNRQILCTEQNLGEPKVFAAQKRVKEINSEISVQPVFEFFSEKNADRLMEGVDLIIDALDNVEARLMMEDAASERGLTVIHGAIEGWNVQALLVPPGSGLLHSLYGKVRGETPKTAMPMTPAVCAAMQVTATVQYLCQGDSPLRQNLLMMSLYDYSADQIPFME